MSPDPAPRSARSSAGGLPLVPTADGVRLRIHVTPRAAAERIGEVIDDARGARLRVHVTAAPHDGKANAAVIRLLAHSWRLPKTALSVVAGANGRDKVVAIRGDAEVLEAKLAGVKAAKAKGRR